MQITFQQYAKHDSRGAMKKTVLRLWSVIVCLSIYKDAACSQMRLLRQEQLLDVFYEDAVQDATVKPNKMRLNRYERSKLQKEKWQNESQQKKVDRARKAQKDQLDRESQESRRVMLGRDYYYALVDVSTQRHWAFPITCNFSVTNGAFDNNGQKTSLGSAALGGGTVRLRDIYLFSRLGDENLVGNRSSAGGGQPASKSPSVAQSGNLPFGAYANDLYTTLLAPMKVGAGIKQRDMCTDFTAMYRFDIAACGRVLGYVGATLPVKAVMVDTDLQLQDGTLYIERFSAGQTVVRERTLTEFFGDYQSVEDFFIREVLGSKGIKFDGNQSRVGLGDFSMFGIIDIGGLWEYADGIQFGLTIVFPTGSPGSPNVLFSPALGDGGYKFEPFFSAIFNSPSLVFNPTVKLVGSFGSRRSSGSWGGTRVGRVLSNGARVQVKDVPGLSAPDRFANYYVSAFDEVACAVPLFADTAVPANITLGNRLLVGVGNYFLDLFNLGFRLGVFYDYMRKSSDTACIDKCHGIFNTAALTANTSERSHSIGVNLTYKFKNMLELNCGGEFVIGGRNVPRTNDFFVSMIAVF